MVDQALAKGKLEGMSTLFDSVAKRSRMLRTEKLSARIDRLRRLRDWTLANRVRIQEAMFADFRKPAMEVEVSEIFTVVADLNHALRNLSSWAKPRLVDAPLTFFGTRSVVRYEPKGACLIIAPWNYPFNLCIGPLVSCIAAGNTAILKPSELTPHTSALIAAMAGEVFEKDVVS